VERTLDWVEVDDDVDAAVVPFPAATADAKQPARVGTAGADA
jgi:hypothetical protein